MHTEASATLLLLFVKRLEFYFGQLLYSSNIINTVEVYSAVHVHPNAVPASPPQNVTAPVLSSTEIQVNWTEPPEIDQNGIITEYEVMYEPLMTFGGLMTVSTVITTNLSITLFDVVVYVEYNISVRAYTSVGPGPYSVGIVNRTYDGIIIMCMLDILHCYL